MRHSVEVGPVWTVVFSVMTLSTVFRGVARVPRVCRTMPTLPMQQVRTNTQRAPSGPNPLDAPTLEAVKQQWKKARFAKDADTAAVLGVRLATYPGYPHGPAIRAEDQGAGEPEAALSDQNDPKGDQEAHRRRAPVPRG